MYISQKWADKLKINYFFHINELYRGGRIPRHTYYLTTTHFKINYTFNIIHNYVYYTKPDDIL